MNIRAVRLADVRYRGFEGVERSKLAEKYMSSFQAGERESPYGIDLNHSFEAILRESREGSKEVTRGTYQTEA